MRSIKRRRGGGEGQSDGERTSIFAARRSKAGKAWRREGWTGKSYSVISGGQHGRAFRRHASRGDEKAADVS